MEISSIVVVVSNNPAELPPRLKIPGAAFVLAAAGQVPPRLLRSVYPISWQAAESTSYMLGEGYAIFYPICGGSALAVKLAKQPLGIPHKSYEPPPRRAPLGDVE